MIIGIRKGLIYKCRDPTARYCGENREATNVSKPENWLNLVTSTLIFCIILSVTASSFGNSLLHSSKPYARAAASPIQRIFVPFFTTAVPFNQTAIFWFGDITSTDNYTDVRVGYILHQLITILMYGWGITGVSCISICALSTAIYGMTRMYKRPI